MVSAQLRVMVVGTSDGSWYGDMNCMRVVNCMQLVYL